MITMELTNQPAMFARQILNLFISLRELIQTSNEVRCWCWRVRNIICCSTAVHSTYIQERDRDRERNTNVCASFHGKKEIEKERKKEWREGDYNKCSIPCDEICATFLQQYTELAIMHPFDSIHILGILKI